MTEPGRWGIFRAVRIYLDHNATTPLCDAAREAMLPWLGRAANASSVHAEGRAARSAVEHAREQLARAIGETATKTITFTAGATEANNLALSVPGALVVDATSHPSVLEPARARDAAEVGVDAAGQLSLDALAAALPGAALCSVNWVNNETGVVQPVSRIAELCRQHGVLFHLDAAQALGKLPVDIATLGCDLLTLSAHKVYGPTGVGALWTRRGRRVEPLIRGGHQERGRRPGTENVAGIVGFGEAVDRVDERLAASARLKQLSERLCAGLNAIGAIRNGEGVPHTVNVRFPGQEGELMLTALDLAGLAVSAGSACSAGSLEPSHVLLAMGLTTQEAGAALRFSLGVGTTAEEIDRTIALVRDVIQTQTSSMEAYV